VYLLIVIRATRNQVNVVALSWALAIVIYYYFYCFYCFFSFVLPGALICVSTMNLLFIVGFLCGINQISLPAALPRPLVWLLAIVLWTAGDAFPFPQGRLVTLVLQAGAAGMVVLLMAQPRVRIPRAFVSLGNASYGVYLIHFIVIERLAAAISVLLALVGLPQRYCSSRRCHLQSYSAYLNMRCTSAWRHGYYAHAFAANFLRQSLRPRTHSQRKRTRTLEI
jgi:peptidoglycan/LPS O-acetylase OafA/YrhL